MTAKPPKPSQSRCAEPETRQGRGDDALKLEALRAAAKLGLSAFDHGKFEQFADASALVAHLNKIADDVAAGIEAIL